MRGEGQPRPLLLAIRAGPPARSIRGGGGGRASGSSCSWSCFSSVSAISTSSLALHRSPFDRRVRGLRWPPSRSACCRCSRVCERTGRCRFGPASTSSRAASSTRAAACLRVFPLRARSSRSIEERSSISDLPGRRHVHASPFREKGHTERSSHASSKGLKTRSRRRKPPATSTASACSIRWSTSGSPIPSRPRRALKKQIPFWARQVWSRRAAVGLVLAPGIWFARNRAERFEDAEPRPPTAERRRLPGLPGAGRTSRRGRRRACCRAPSSRRGQRRHGRSGREVHRRVTPTPRFRTRSPLRSGRPCWSSSRPTKRAGTVSALTEFAKRHPNNLVDAELKQAMHAVYQGALAKYKRTRA